MTENPPEDSTDQTENHSRQNPHAEPQRDPDAPEYDHDHEEVSPRDGAKNTMRNTRINTDGGDPDGSGGESEDNGVSRDDAHKEAVRKINAADGDSRYEQVLNAEKELQQSFQSFAQKAEQAKQRKNDAETQRRQLKSTRDKLKEIKSDPTDDRFISRDWAAGITTEVTRDELPDIIDQIEDRRESLKDRVESAQTQYDRLERGREKVAAALDIIHEKKEAFAEVASTEQSLAQQRQQEQQGQPQQRQNRVRGMDPRQQGAPQQRRQQPQRQPRQQGGADAINPSGKPDAPEETGRPTSVDVNIEGTPGQSQTENQNNEGER